MLFAYAVTRKISKRFWRWLIIRIRLSDNEHWKRSAHAVWRTISTCFGNASWKWLMIQRTMFANKYVHIDPLMFCEVNSYLVRSCTPCATVHLIIWKCTSSKHWKYSIEIPIAIFDDEHIRFFPPIDEQANGIFYEAKVDIRSVIVYIS